MTDVLIRFPSVDVPTKHRFTLDDILRWKEAGFIDPDGRYELIDGSLIVMPADGALHTDYKAEITAFLNRNADPSRRVIPDSTLMLSAYDNPSPDVYVFQAGAPARPMQMDALHLVIEISDTSLSYDLNDKLALYARFGVLEYWIVDVRARRTQVFHSPDRSSYPEPTKVSFGAALRPRRLPEIALVIDDLPYIGTLEG